MRSNTTGGSNTAVGYNALANNTIGLQNTAMGWSALSSNIDGFSNSAFGDRALIKVTTGGLNTGMGDDALANITIGERNTSIGSNSQIFLQGASSNNTALGCLAGASTGVPQTYSYTTFVGASCGTNNTVNDTTAVGFAALQLNTTGASNAAFGRSAGLSIRTGSNNTLFGNFTDAPAGASGITVIGTSVTGSVNGGLYFNPGLATVSSVAVNYNTTTGQMGPVTSTRRFKTDIRDSGIEAHKVLDLRLVDFTWDTDGMQGQRDFGFIAEEVHEVLPELVPLDADGNPFSVNYDKVGALLVGVVKHQQYEIGRQGNELKRQKTQIDKQVEEIEELKKQLHAIQKMIGNL